MDSSRFSSHISAFKAEFKSFFALIWIFHLTSASVGLQELTARPGDDVILNCRGPNNVSIVLEWTRTDLERTKYVFFYRDGQSDLTNPHPSFEGRVELLDREMKNGKLSLILKNVGRNDSGKYECHFWPGGTRRSKRDNIDTEPGSIINLKVEETGLQELTARPGDDIILNCRGPNNVSIVLEWTRTDLERTKYVFFYRDGQSDLTNPHPSFEGRVELLDREMKNGKLSLILKNVGRNDSGKYECHFWPGGTRRSKRDNIDTEPGSIINLKVEETVHVLDQYPVSYEKNHFTAAYNNSTLAE